MKPTRTYCGPQMTRTVDELRFNPNSLEASVRSGVTRGNNRSIVARRGLILRARAIRARRHRPDSASRLWLLAAARKRNKEGALDVTLPLRESSASLVDTATRVLRERAATNSASSWGNTQTHIFEKGASMLSDAIEQEVGGCDRSRPRSPESSTAHQIYGANRARFGH